jgi:predicted nucleic acid-binding protein
MATNLVLYWDASAVISALFKGVHSEQAWEMSRREGVHLMSSLSLAETHAVINRMARERVLADVLIKAALEALATGPWRYINLSPGHEEIAKLGVKWPLRGADLWHLSLAVSLKSHLPELSLLTFDSRLQMAARGEQLSL